MEDFKQIIAALQTNDWQTRLKNIDQLVNFVQTYQIQIKSAQTSKFIQLIDIFCRLLGDNNVKVQTQA